MEHSGYEELLSALKLKEYGKVIRELHRIKATAACLLPDILSACDSKERTLLHAAVAQGADDLVAQVRVICSAQAGAPDSLPLSCMDAATRVGCSSNHHQPAERLSAPRSCGGPP